MTTVHFTGRGYTQRNANEALSWGDFSF